MCSPTTTTRTLPHWPAATSRRDRDDVEHDARWLVDEFNRLRGRPGYFTETFCERSRFFQPKNGARVDAIREAIVRKGLDPLLEAVVLTSLMEAADRVDSTVGQQMMYLAKWAPRSYNDLRLRLPDLLPRAWHGRGEAHQLEAVGAAAVLDADLIYIDPPYNQHSYLGNYHVWESLILWDKPEVYGKACKRIDCKTRRSEFNSKRKCLGALRSVLDAIAARVVVVSFNDEGYIGRAQMEALLARRGDVRVLEKPHKRYVGAQIGIYNPAGEKVGQPGRRNNKEYLFVAGDLSGVSRQGIMSTVWAELAAV